LGAKRKDLERTSAGEATKKSLTKVKPTHLSSRKNYDVLTWKRRGSSEEADEEGSSKVEEEF